MNSPVDLLINTLKSMLLQEPEDLMDNYEDFASMVTNLRDYSWRLSTSQHLFLDRLLEVRDQMIKDFPFIDSVEASRLENQRSTAGGDLPTIREKKEPQKRDS
jgi:hypothetical protein